MSTTWCRATTSPVVTSIRAATGAVRSGSTPIGSSGAGCCSTASAELAGHVAESMLALVRRSGFREYFDPVHRGRVWVRQLLVDGGADRRPHRAPTRGSSVSRVTSAQAASTEDLCACNSSSSSSAPASRANTSPSPFPPHRPTSARSAAAGSTSRLCATCGHTGCCDSQAGHARIHANATGHPVIYANPRGGGFVWCYPHNRYL